MTDDALTFLGRTNWRGQSRLFGIRQRDRRSHLYVVGKTGTGKSSLLEMMARQDVIAGNGFALFDPHGDLAERLYAWIPESKRANVVYLNVPDPNQPFGFNPLEGVPPIKRSLAANSIVEALKKIFDDAWGVRLEYILRNALLVLLEFPGATLADVVRLFHEKDFRTEAAERCSNEYVKRFWLTEFEKFGRHRSEAVTPIENKIGSLLVDPFVSRILTVSESTFSPTEIMDSGKILIVNISKGRIGEAPSMLFGGLLMTMLGLAGLARADTSERRDFFIYVDEFHVLTTLSLVNFLAELRAFRVGLVFAHQFLDQIDSDLLAAILGNVGTLISFRVGSIDAARIVKELLPSLDPYELTLLPNRTFWIRPLVRGQSVEAFTAETIAIASKDVAMPAA